MGINIDGARDLVSAGDGSLTIEGFSINTSGIATFTGGVYVGTAASIYSNGNVTAGIVTATEFAVGTAVTIGKTNGNATFAGIVTATSLIGQTVTSTNDLKTTAGTVNVKSGSSINTNSDSSAHGALHKNTNSGEFAIVSGGTGGDNYLSFYTSSSGAPSAKLQISAGGNISAGTAATIFANGNATFSGIGTFAHAALTGTSESAIFTQAATAGGTTDIEFETADNFIITMGGNTSITAGNQKVGQTGSIFMVQDGTGSRTASWHADFKWTGGTAPTLTTTASAIDRIDYFVKASNQIHAVASLDVK